MAKQRFDPTKAAKVLALVLGSPSLGERASARHMLPRMLGAHGIAGRDLLPRHYLDRGDVVVIEQVNGLLHPLWGDDDAACEQHRAFVERRLIRYRLGWSDLIEQLRSGSSDPAAWSWLLDNTGTALVITEEISVSILDEISYLLGQYVVLDPDQLVVVTLWAAHTHVYHRYMCSPRLAVCGPMDGIGKTVAFDALIRIATPATSTSSMCVAAKPIRTSPTRLAAGRPLAS